MMAAITTAKSRSADARPSQGASGSVIQYFSLQSAHGFGDEHFAHCAGGHETQQPQGQRRPCDQQAAGQCAQGAETAAAQECLHGAAARKAAQAVRREFTATIARRRRRIQQYAQLLARLCEPGANQIPRCRVALFHDSGSEDSMRSRMTLSSCHSRCTSANIGERWRATRARKIKAPMATTTNTPAIQAIAATRYGVFQV